MDVFDATNKVVIVTGGASGIGAGVVESFLQEGAKHVAFLDVNEKLGRELETRLKSEFGVKRTQFINCDITKERDLLEAYDDILKEFDYIDVVVNNAGIMNDAKYIYRKAIDLNVTALVTSTLKAIEVMRKDEGGKGGTVINCASVLALCQRHCFPIYHATKSAVLQFSNCIGMEPHYSRTGVRVITICFGKTDTALLHNLQSFDEKTTQEIPELLDRIRAQKPESAVKGVMDVFRNGISGSTWVAIGNRPSQDVTAKVKEAYSVLQSILDE